MNSEDSPRGGVEHGDIPIALDTTNLGEASAAAPSPLEPVGCEDADPGPATLSPTVSPLTEIPNGRAISEGSGRRITFAEGLNPPKAPERFRRPSGPLSTLENMPRGRRPTPSPSSSPRIAKDDSNCCSRVWRAICGGLDGIADDVYPAPSPVVPKKNPATAALPHSVRRRSDIELTDLSPRKVSTKSIPEMNLDDIEEDDALKNDHDRAQPRRDDGDEGPAPPDKLSMKKRKKKVGLPPLASNENEAPSNSFGIDHSYSGSFESAAEGSAESSSEMPKGKARDDSVQYERIMQVTGVPGEPSFLFERSLRLQELVKISSPASELRRTQRADCCVNRDSECEIGSPSPAEKCSILVSVNELEQPRRVHSGANRDTEYEMLT